ncbi:MAG: hypothetical protein DWQ02_05640 [Bacteroidetes bacterium]|nr:MAG: hypothetical protein DWQ02_05640 [Bacteroidota bacterium]
MTNSLLQNYLTSQHLRTSNDDDVTRLNRAITEVVKRLKKKKTKIIPFTLVGLDPLIDENDPVVLEVEKILISKWPAFKNSVTNTGEIATTYIRVVILEALNRLIKEEDLAAIIWHTSRDVVSFFNMSEEREIIGPFLKEIGNKIEALSHNHWSINHAVDPDSFEAINIEIKSVEIPSISKDDIEDHLLAAAQHTGWAAHSKNIGSNPQTPNNHLWAAPFASRAAEGLAKEWNTSLTALGKNFNAIAISLQEDIKKPLSNFVLETSSSITQRAIANNKRSELLWWKQTLYSPSQDKSYRSLESVSSAISMAVDLAQMVHPIYPHSVDFLLRETLKDIYGDQIDSPQPFSDWMDRASQLNEIERSSLLSLSEEREGRKSFGTALANYLNKENSSDIFTETGISKTAEIALGDLAVWLFHDLQATKIAKTKR